MSYCVECKHYIPGGAEHNCSHPSRKYRSYVCAIQEACKLYESKEEQEQVKASQKPINLRTKKKQRRFKSDKCNNEQTL